MESRTYEYHYEEEAAINISPEKVFAYLDDHARLSSHMNNSSWMMGGGKMNITTDEGRGQKVGSHIRLSGKAFGTKIFLDEVVTKYEPPRSKLWETVGALQLVIIGNYRMGVELKPRGATTALRIYIDYKLPEKNGWLGKLFGKMYAKWCVRQMLYSVRDNFKNDTDIVSEIGE